jgi:hypothetical protein
VPEGHPHYQRSQFGIVGVRSFLLLLITEIVNPNRNKLLLCFSLSLPFFT